MKKNLLIILVSFLLTIGLTGCYTELLTTNAALASDNPDNTTIIYYPVPVPVPDPTPGCPRPVQPQPVYSPVTQPNNPGNKSETKRPETTLRNNNGGRGNVQQTQRSARIEPANNNSPRNNNGSRNSSGRR